MKHAALLIIVADTQIFSFQDNFVVRMITKYLCGKTFGWAELGG